MGAFLEVSTSIPCILNCHYCPQGVLREAYKSDIKNLSYENFVVIINKIPPNSTITWSAFNEPFQNTDTTDMIIYAHKMGHRVQINTTLVGLSIEKYKKIMNLPFGIFGVHLPDSEGKTVVPITFNYINLLKFIVEHPPKNINFNYHEGTVHPQISHLIPNSHKLVIHNRSGLLNAGRKDNHPNVSRCGHQFQFTNSDGGCILLPNGDCVTCCQSFNMEEYLGNLLTQSWDDIKKNIRLTNLCKVCRYAVEE